MGASAITTGGLGASAITTDGLGASCVVAAPSVCTTPATTGGAAVVTRAALRRNGPQLLIAPALPTSPIATRTPIAIRREVTRPGWRGEGAAVPASVRAAALEMELWGSSCFGVSAVGCSSAWALFASFAGSMRGAAASEMVSCSEGTSPRAGTPAAGAPCELGGATTRPISSWSASAISLAEAKRSSSLDAKARWNQASIAGGRPGRTRSARDELGLLDRPAERAEPVLVLERELACQGLVGDDGQGPEVGSVVDGLGAEELLRAHVASVPTMRPVVSSFPDVAHLGHAEVEHLDEDLAVRVEEEDVARLDVAVDDARARWPAETGPPGRRPAPRRRGEAPARLRRVERLRRGAAP